MFAANVERLFLGDLLCLSQFVNVRLEFSTLFIHLIGLGLFDWFHPVGIDNSVFVGVWIFGIIQCEQTTEGILAGVG